MIVPDKRANLGRFLSGINNAKKSKKDQNVKSIRMSIMGSIRVLLYASRNIKKGETLKYDYNEGGDDYPTEDFV